MNLSNLLSSGVTLKLGSRLPFRRSAKRVMTQQLNGEGISGSRSMLLNVTLVDLLLYTAEISNYTIANPFWTANFVVTIE